MRILRCFPFFAAFVSVANGQNISVVGKITPAACTADFEGGAHLDWGAIRWTSLHPTKMTTLKAKQITLRVQCPEGAKTGMAFQAGADPNALSALAGPDSFSASGAANHSEPRAIFGIGADPVTQEKIGNFTMTGISSSHDGIASKAAYGVAGNGSPHTAGSYASVSMGYPIYREAVDTVWDEATGKPALAAVYTFTFSIEPQLNAKSKISATEEVPFSGVAQFNVRY